MSYHGTALVALQAGVQLTHTDPELTESTKIIITSGRKTIPPPPPTLKHTTLNHQYLSNHNNHPTQKKQKTKWGKGYGILVVETAKHGNATPSPMTGRLLGRHSDAHQKVGGVAGGGQHSPPLPCSVHRAVVHMAWYNVHQQCRLQLHERSMHMQDLGLGFTQHFVHRVPSASLHEEAFDVGALRWHLRWLTVQHEKLEAYAIDGKFPSPCIVLESCSHKGLRKEEAADPVRGGSPTLIPILQYLVKLLQKLSF